MQKAIVASRAATFGVMLLAAFVLFFNLDDRDLWPSHEARAAQNARGFLESGDWGLLRAFDGRPDYQKPPLYYWLASGIGWVRGGVIDAWSVRLPSAISAWLTVGIVVLWLQRRGRPWAGVIAGLSLLCANHFVSIARTGRIDVPLTASVTAAVLSLVESRWLVATLAMASAVMLKGPIGIVLALGVVCSWRIDWRYLAILLKYATRRVTSRSLAGHHFLPSPLALRGKGQGEGERLASKRGSSSHSSVFPPHPNPLPPQSRVERGSERTPPRGVLVSVMVALLLAAPWFIAVTIQSRGEFARAFFFHHNLDRMTGSASDLASHPWWTYGLRWLVNWLPATPALLIAIWLVCRKRTWRTDSELRLGLVWIVAMTALLSLSRFKRADYLLPAYPGAAIVIGCVAEHWYRASKQRGWLIAFGGLTLATAVAGAIVYQTTILPSLDERNEMRAQAQKIIGSGAHDRPIIFFRVEDHLLAFHIGKPVQCINEWENLDIWVSRLKCGRIVMPADEVRTWSNAIRAGTLREIMRFADPNHDRALVVMESRPHPKTGLR